MTTYHYNLVTTPSQFNNLLKMYNTVMTHNVIVKLLTDKPSLRAWNNDLEYCSFEQQSCIVYFTQISSQKV